jgi:hypothetical protein
MAQDYSIPSPIIMVDEDVLEGLIEQAAGVVAASCWKVKVHEAMSLVGIAAANKKQHKTIYQQVRRRASKVGIVDLEPRRGSVEVITLSTGGAGAGSLSSLTGPSSFEFLSPSVGAHHHHCNSSVLSSGSSKSEDKKPAAKVFRRTSKEVQRANAKTAQLTKRDKQAMKQATVLIERSKVLPKGHPEKKSMAAIVEETNERLDANISVNSAARYVRQGLIGVSPIKRGPIGDIPPLMYTALKGAFVTYLKLEQAGSKKQSTIKDLAKLVNGCVNKVGFSKKRDDLTRKLKRESADEFAIGIKPM